MTSLQKWLSHADAPYSFENQPIILIKQNLLHANI